MGSLDDLKNFGFFYLITGTIRNIDVSGYGGRGVEDQLCEQTGYRIGLSAVYRGYRSVCITGMAWKK